MKRINIIIGKILIIIGIIILLSISIYCAFMENPKLGILALGVLITSIGVIIYNLE